MCQKIMSAFFKNKYCKSKRGHEDVEEDYEVENPYYRNRVSDYAIREKRPCLNKKGFYNIYVVHSGVDSGDES